MPTTSHEVTQLLIEWGNGDQAALDRLMPLVYGELRQMARRYMARQNPGHTLQTTALINEAYMRMVGGEEKQFQNRAHFFGVAAQAMRHILVDYARSKNYAKRGGDAPKVSLDEALTVSDAFLEKAFDIRSEELLLLKVEPIYDSLRSDARYADLLKRLKLAP